VLERRRATSGSLVPDRRLRECISPPPRGPRLIGAGGEYFFDRFDSEGNLVPLSDLPDVDRR